MWRISNDEARTIYALPLPLPLPLPKMPPTLLPLSTATTTELDNGDSTSPLSLSLRYLPISSNSSDHSPSTPPPPDPSDFSFFSDFFPDVCYADELFGEGRLLPCKPQRPPAPSTEMSKIRNTKPLPFPHHRSASLNRASLRHAERPTLRRAASDSDPSTTAPPQLRWYEVFMLGPGRFPGIVEMRELRSRQRRPQSPPPTPTLQRSASLPWKLLRSLSCRGMESTAAITAGPRLI